MGLALGKVVPIGPYRVKITKLLGEGGYAYVFLGKEVNSGQQFAVKRMVAQNQETVRAIEREIDFMRRMRHAHIVRLFHSETQHRQGEAEYYILMEYCPRTVVSEMNAAQGRRLAERHVLEIFLSVCRALAHLHTQSPPVFHRDIKVENVLIGEDGVYKLCDFGSAVQRAPVVARTQTEILHLEEDVQRNTTPCYRAPEMVDLYRRKPVGHMADIWALGCLLYTLCFYENPFERGGDLAITNINVEYPMGHPYSPAIVALIDSMFEPDPEMRPTVSEVAARACSLLGVPLPKDIPPPAGPVLARARGEAEAESAPKVRSTHPAQAHPRAPRDASPARAAPRTSAPAPASASASAPAGRAAPRTGRLAANLLFGGAGAEPAHPPTRTPPPLPTADGSASPAVRPGSHALTSLFATQAQAQAQAQAQPSIDLFGAAAARPPAPASGAQTDLFASQRSVAATDLFAASAQGTLSATKAASGVDLFASRAPHAQGTSAVSATAAAKLDLFGLGQQTSTGHDGRDLVAALTPASSPAVTPAHTPRPSPGPSPPGSPARTGAQAATSLFGEAAPPSPSPLRGTAALPVPTSTDLFEATAPSPRPSPRPSTAAARMNLFDSQPAPPSPSAPAQPPPSTAAARMSLFDSAPAPPSPSAPAHAGSAAPSTAAARMGLFESAAASPQSAKASAAPPVDLFGVAAGPVPAVGAPAPIPVAVAQRSFFDEAGLVATPNPLVGRADAVPSPMRATGFDYASSLGACILKATSRRTKPPGRRSTETIVSEVRRAASLDPLFSALETRPLFTIAHVALKALTVIHSAFLAAPSLRGDLAGRRAYLEDMQAQWAAATSRRNDPVLAPVISRYAGYLAERAAFCREHLGLDEPLPASALPQDSDELSRGLQALHAVLSQAVHALALVVEALARSRTPKGGDELRPVEGPCCALLLDCSALCGAMLTRIEHGARHGSEMHVRLSFGPLYAKAGQAYTRLQGFWKQVRRVGGVAARVAFPAETELPPLRDLGASPVLRALAAPPAFLPRPKAAAAESRSPAALPRHRPQPSQSGSLDGIWERYASLE